MVHRTLASFSDGEESPESTQDSGPSFKSTAASETSDIEDSTADKWEAQFNMASEGDRHAGLTPESSLPTPLDVSATATVGPEDLPDTKESTILWDPIVKPFNGARIITPSPSQSSINIPGTSSIEATNIAYVVDGLSEYLQNTDGKPLRVPKYYSRFEDEFDTYIGAWTTTAENGAIGIDAQLLEQMIRLADGPGKIDHRSVTVYGCGTQPAVVEAGDNVFLFSLNPVTPTDRHTPDDNALFDIKKGISVSEETAIGQQALGRLISGLDQLGLPVASYHQTTRGTVDFAIKEEARGLSDQDEPHVSTNTATPVDSDGETQYASIPTKDIRTAASGFKTYEELVSDLESRPEFPDSHLETLPEPPVTPGERLETALPAYEINETIPPAVLSIDYDPPFARSTRNDVSKQQYGVYRISVLAEYESYKSGTHRVLTYNIPATVRKQPIHSEITRERTDIESQPRHLPATISDLSNTE